MSLKTIDMLSLWWASCMHAFLWHFWFKAGGTLTRTLRVFTTHDPFTWLSNLALVKHLQFREGIHTHLTALQSGLTHSLKEGTPPESTKNPSESSLTCILLPPTLLSENWKMPRSNRDNIGSVMTPTRERVVNTLLGVRVPPVITKAVNVINMISTWEKVREVARLLARIKPPCRMIKNSFLWC